MVTETDQETPVITCVEDCRDAKYTVMTQNLQPAAILSTLHWPHPFGVCNAAVAAAEERCIHPLDSAWRSASTTHASCCNQAPCQLNEWVR